MTLADLTALVQTLYNYTRTARLTADEHADALAKAKELVQEFTLLLQRAEELSAPKAEVMGTEKKVVGGPVTSKKK